MTSFEEELPKCVELGCRALGIEKTLVQHGCSLLLDHFVQGLASSNCSEMVVMLAWYTHITKWCAQSELAFVVTKRTYSLRQPHPLLAKRLPQMQHAHTTRKLCCIAMIKVPMMLIRAWHTRTREVIQQVHSMMTVALYFILLIFKIKSLVHLSEEDPHHAACALKVTIERGRHGGMGSGDGEDERVLLGMLKCDEWAS